MVIDDDCGLDPCPANGLAAVAAWMVAEEARISRRRKPQWFSRRAEEKADAEYRRLWTTACNESALAHLDAWRLSVGAPIWVYPVGSRGLPNAHHLPNMLLRGEDSLRRVRELDEQRGTPRSDNCGLLDTTVPRRPSFAGHAEAKRHARDAIWGSLTDAEVAALERFTNDVWFSKPRREPGGWMSDGPMPDRETMRAVLRRTMAIPVLTVYRTEILDPERRERLQALSVGDSFADWDDHVSTSVLPYPHPLGRGSDALIANAFPNADALGDGSKLTSVVFEVRTMSGLTLIDNARDSSEHILPGGLDLYVVGHADLQLANGARHWVIQLVERRLLTVSEAASGTPPACPS